LRIALLPPYFGGEGSGEPPTLQRPVDFYFG
jgi:hypothetical protein